MGKHIFFDRAEWDTDVPKSNSQLESVKPIVKQKKKKNRKNKQTSAGTSGTATAENVTKVSKKSKKKLKAKQKVDSAKGSPVKKEKIKEIAKNIKDILGGDGAIDGIAVVNPKKSKKRKKFGKNKKETNSSEDASTVNKESLEDKPKKIKSNSEEKSNSTKPINGEVSTQTTSMKRRMRRNQKLLLKLEEAKKNGDAKKLKKTKTKNNLKLAKLLKDFAAKKEAKKSVPANTSETKEVKQSGASTFKEKLMENLKGSRFRFLNEQLYTSTGSEAAKLFKEEPEAFTAYHKGFTRQVQKWPMNPLDKIIRKVKRMSNDLVVADFGCGEARLSTSVPQKVFSLDLVALNDNVTSCNMAHTPLKNGSVDVAVFCLSLMGTNLMDYLSEANRVLKIGGVLKIAEVASRFTDVSNFIDGVQKLGFKNTKQNLSNNMFYFMDFEKISEVAAKKKLPQLKLNPCYYKKR